MKEEQEEADGREKLDQLASLMIGASPHREAFILLLLEPGFLVPIGKRYGGSRGGGREREGDTNLAFSYQSHSLYPTWPFL